MRTVIYQLKSTDDVALIKSIHKNNKQLRKIMKMAKDMGLLHHVMSYQQETHSILVTQMFKDEESMLAYIKHVLPHSSKIFLQELLGDSKRPGYDEINKLQSSDNKKLKNEPTAI